MGELEKQMMKDHERRSRTSLELIEARREIVRLKEELAKAQARSDTAGPSNYAELERLLRKMDSRSGEARMEAAKEIRAMFVALSRARRPPGRRQPELHQR